MTPSPVRSQKLAGASVLVFGSPLAACRQAADHIARIIHGAEREGRSPALGLATGGTPVPLYARLVELHRAGELSLQKAVSFNLDEYYPISPLDPRSYRHYMHQHLFRHVDLPANRAHVLDGTVPDGFTVQHCAEFDGWIEAAGGLDVQLLGIGRNGHIGFNEPCDLPARDMMALPSRRVPLHAITLEDAARDFGGDMRLVPREALTMGVKPILASRSILMLAFGARKADIVARALKGPVISEVPASLLQSIPGRVTWLLDEEAASRL